MYSLEELQNRHSVRNYGAEQISAPCVNRLNAEATFVTSHEAGVNFHFIVNDGAPFDGFKRSYGMFSGVNNYLAAIVDPSYTNCYERAGYFGESFVMKCIENGLGTCFVSGTFSAIDVNVPMKVFEKIAFLITVGFEKGKGTLISRMTSKLVHRKTIDYKEFFVGTEDEYKEALTLIPNLKEGLKAIACAPSAMNKRPVRLHLIEKPDGKYLAAYTPDDSSAMQIVRGIAKFNFASVVDGEWDWGQDGIFYPA